MSRTMTRDAVEHDRLTSTAPSATSRSHIGYYSQVRMSHGGNVVVDWIDACGGHEGFDNAVTCGAAEEALIEGRLEPNNSVDAVKVSCAAHNRKNGASYEYRIIKRSHFVSEIVVDGEGAEVSR